MTQVDKLYHFVLFTQEHGVIQYHIYFFKNKEE